MEVMAMSRESRLQALERARLVHPRPEAVSAERFRAGDPFFLAADKVQVKYEMLRAVAVDGETVVAAAAAHGYWSAPAPNSPATSRPASACPCTAAQPSEPDAHEAVLAAR
jgi:hypothetical protein